MKFKFLYLSVFLLFIPACKTSDTQKYLDLRNQQRELIASEREGIAKASAGIDNSLTRIETPSPEVTAALGFNQVISNFVGPLPPEQMAAVELMVSQLIEGNRDAQKELQRMQRDAERIKKEKDAVTAKVESLEKIVTDQSFRLEEIERNRFWNRIKRWAVGTFGLALGGVVMYLVGPLVVLGLVWGIFVSFVRFLVSSAPKLAYRMVGAVSSKDVKEVVSGIGHIRKDKKRILNSEHCTAEEKRIAEKELKEIDLQLKSYIKNKDLIDEVRKDLDV